MRTKHDYEDKALGSARSGGSAPAPERTPTAPEVLEVLPERPDAEYLLLVRPRASRKRRRKWPTPS
jgi:hypothetical protein